jgi:hypothetical protein
MTAAADRPDGRGRGGEALMGSGRWGLWRRWINLLLVVPFIAVLWVPFYNRIEPRFLGIPFFYAYQLAWVWLGAGLTWIVYAVDKGGRGA